jgi:hypothetical protein
MLYLIIFLVFTLASYGCTQILTVGSIFKSIRPQHHFFHCAMCIGFWVGIIMYNVFLFISLFILPKLWLALWTHCVLAPVWYMPSIFLLYLLGAFVSGCISSGTSYFLCKSIGDDGITVNIKMG